MKVKDEEGNKLSDQEILDNIVSLVVAGYETTALASTWALYFLAKYPNVLEKLRVCSPLIFILQQKLVSFHPNLL